MRRSAWSVPLLAFPLFCALTLHAGCRDATTPDGRSPDKGRKSAPEVVLPDPLPLPAEPRVASWIAEPSRAVAMLAPYSPTPIDLKALAEQALAPLTDPALATELARAIDLREPFGNVMLDDGQEIIRIGLLAEAREFLVVRFAELEPAGDFGAVRLPRVPSEKPTRVGAREWLAWIDGDSLVLGNTLEGLVTARQLGPTYGKEPIYFTVDASTFSAELPIDVPFSRVSGHGTLEALHVEAQAVEGRDPLAGAPIAAGTLSGLLDDPSIAAGGSSRYADYKDVVQEITSQVNAQVRELPFLIKGIGEDLAAKLNTTLRTWDGRVLVALGPPNHVRLAYGANDVAKSGVATLRLLDSIVDNLSLARNFTSQVPKVSLRRRVGKADGVDIELLVVAQAASLVPELRPLVDREGRLNIAMAWSERAGGGVIVVGPDAVAQLSAWLTSTAASPSAAVTAEQLLAATLAIAPELLVPLLTNPQPDLAALLGHSASGPRWDVEVQSREGGRYVVELRTPGPPKPARAK